MVGWFLWSWKKNRKASCPTSGINDRKTKSVICVLSELNKKPKEPRC
jgi:hypothetical protein